MPKTLTDVHHDLDRHWQRLKAKYRQEHGPAALEAAERVINDQWLAAFAQHAFEGTEADDTLMNWFLRELKQVTE